LRIETAGLAGCAVVLALLGSLAGCGGPQGPETPVPRSPAQVGSSEPLRLAEAASGFESPVALARRGGRLYVVEQAGRVVELRSRAVLLDLRARVRSGGEQGLLSVAFHPRRARLVAHYTDRRGDTRVMEYSLVSGGAVLRRQLLFVDQPYPNHNGGQLAFSPDGRLWLGLGDGGDAFDPQARAQDPDSRLGKLLRLDVDRPGVPRWEVVAHGLRNPWRFSFDRSTGDLYVADVGQDRWEEIDFVRDPGRERLNFGWDVFEGPDRLEDKRPTGDAPLVWPVTVYGHDQGCSVTGGHVYRGALLPAMRGRYLYGDYCSGRVWSLRMAGRRAVEVRRERVALPLLSSFGEDAKGELYLVSQRGTVHRLVGG
jgi:glucose/arabinose dehydrogenase